MPNELVWNGAKVKEDFDKSLFKSLKLSGITVQGRAVRLVAVDTGILKSSITYVVFGESKAFPQATGLDASDFKVSGDRTIRPGKGEVIIGTIVFYAAYVEFGTRYATAQPFLLPAYRNSLEDIKSIFRKEFGSIRWLT